MTQHTSIVHDFWVNDEGAECGLAPAQEKLYCTVVGLGPLGAKMWGSCGAALDRQDRARAGYS